MRHLCAAAGRLGPCQSVGLECQHMRHETAAEIVLGTEGLGALGNGPDLANTAGGMDLDMIAVVGTNMVSTGARALSFGST